MVKDRLISKKEVLGRTGFSDSTLDVEVKKGNFPESIPITDGGYAVRWSEMAVDEWIERRKKLAAEGKLKRAPYYPHMAAPGKRGPGRPRKNPRPEEVKEGETV